MFLVVMIEATFFDHFGFLLWIFLVWIAVADLRNRDLVRWPRVTLLLIGIIGIVLDGVLLIGLYAGWVIAKSAWVFDHLGIPVFLFLIWLAFGDLKNDKVSRARWTKWALMVVAVLGLLADGFILVRHYLGL